MRIPTTRFENLRMREDETISSFHDKIGEISNEAYGIGDPYSNERLVSKFIRALPERYNIKVSSIEEANDISTLQLSELVSILTTFEMKLEEHKAGYKAKNVALKSFTTPASDTTNFTESHSDYNEDFKLDENHPNLALLIKKFNSLSNP